MGDRTPIEFFVFFVNLRWIKQYKKSGKRNYKENYVQLFVSFLEKYAITLFSWSLSLFESAIQIKSPNSKVQTNPARKFVKPALNVEKGKVAN